MINESLKSLLKSKADRKKSIKELIETFIRKTKENSSKELKEALSSLLVFIDQNHDLDEKSLRKLIKNRIEDMKINFRGKELEEVYIALSLASFPQARMSFVFDKVDIDAIEAMRKSFYWVQTEYNQNFQNRLKDIIEDSYRGRLPRVELATKIREEFHDLFNHDVRYFEGVADHIISQSQNVARVNQARKYGVSSYKVVAVMDSKTSQICRSMNGRIISAKHLQNQADNIVSAKDIGSKKAAAIWRNEPFLGKDLPKNFGLPPYHFRCRTEVVPVWVDKKRVDGKTMRYTDFDKSKEVLSHVDKTGVERKLTRHNYYEGNHTKPLYKKTPKKDIISALNSITEIAPHKQIKNYTNAWSSNGYFVVFNGEQIVTIFKPYENKKPSYDYFKSSIAKDKKEIIKWTIENLL